jgi:N-methylhydantoinase A/oxoprolinase/acetone carboxylase beta subunit
MKNIWIGIDTGGTFTDLMLADLTTGTYHDHQLPTTTTDAAVVLGQSSTGIYHQSSATCARNAAPSNMHRRSIDGLHQQSRV